MSLFIVLLERKLLAFAQRRLGPSIMGRNGAFQIALDLGKLLTKEVFILPRPSSFLAPFFLALFYGVQLSFSQLFIFGPSMFLFENTDSMLFHHLIFTLIGNIFLMVVGFLSQSKYAILGTVRSVIHVISLDIFITVVYSLLVLSSQSVNFHDFVLAQHSYWYFFLFAPAASGFIIILLMESKRAPFDHSETESEVVAGYAVEYSGPMLMIFFLGEYLHLLIAGNCFTIFFLGGWNILYIYSVLPPIFYLANDIHYWYFLFF
jgi:NADH-quinone oxidoreductase subunit H